jgi:hypothetical protein
MKLMKEFENKIANRASIESFQEKLEIIKKDMDS